MPGENSPDSIWIKIHRFVKISELKSGGSELDDYEKSS